MAIEVNSFELPTTPEIVRNTLQKHSNDFGIFIDLDRCYELIALVYQSRLTCSQVLQQMAGGNLQLDNKQSVINLLISNGVPAQEFGPYCNLLNASIFKQIKDNPVYAQAVKDFVSYYELYNSLKNRLGTLKGYTTLPQSERWSKEGHRLVEAHPTWSIANTSRMLAENPGIHGIAKDYSDLIAEPEGYNLIRCDSNQIEPRITYSYFIRDELMINLITLYNDAYMGMLEYCLLTDEEIAKYTNDFSLYKKVNIDDDFKAKRKEFKVLALAANYGSTNLSNVNASLGAAYEKRIINHPKRIEWQQRVRDQVERGNTVFHGAFGTPVVPKATTKYAEGSSGWSGHIIRCGINNPVQTTAAELMMISVNEATKIMKEAEDTHIAFYKHDEGAFYVSDKDKENGILDRLSDITAYNVKNWIPIPCEPEYGVIKSQFPTVL